MNHSKYFLLPLVTLALMSSYANAIDFGSLVNSAINQAKEAATAPQDNSSPSNGSAQQSRTARPTPSQPAPTSSTNQASNSVSVADFRNKWCQNIDKSTVSPLDYRSMKAGDACLLPDDVIAGVLMKLKQNRVDVINLNTVITSQLQNVDGGDTKFPLITIVFSPKDNKAYVAIFAAVICPTSDLNSLSDGNSFRVALDGKYGKPSAIITEYEKFKVQVDDAEKMIADQKKKIVTVGDAKSVREGEQQVGILKNMLNNMDKKTPAQLNWEYDSKNKVDGQTGVIVGKLQNSDISGDIRCRGDISTAFMIQVSGTSSLQAVLKKIANNVRQDEAAKEKNAPAPKL